MRGSEIRFDTVWMDQKEVAARRLILRKPVEIRVHAATLRAVITQQVSGRYGHNLILLDANSANNKKRMLSK